MGPMELMYSRTAPHPGTILSPSWYQDVFYIRIIKIIIFENSFKNQFLGYFRDVLGAETSKKYMGASILMKKTIFKKATFKNSIFRYFLTFGLYFDVREHYHQTRLEKTRILSYFQIVWPHGRPEQPKTTSCVVFSHHKSS